jgi:predicted helicase
MPDRNLFDRYILELRRTRLADKTEHTDRAALQELLVELASETQKGITVQHEPKRVADKGAPDFKIGKGGLILGYVENKGIDENLNKVLKSAQIAKYQNLSRNIILTDYLDFIWINRYGPPQRERLCQSTDVESQRFRLRDDRVEAVSKLLIGFFSSPPEGIGKSQQLALALAVRSKLLHDYLGEELVRQERGEHKEERLYGLYQVFRDQIFHELTLNQFADAFAQMLAYGLFLARLNSDSKTITLHNARRFVPGSFRLIRELVEFLTELEKDEYRDVRWVVEEVLSIINNLDIPAIHEDLSFRQRKAISRKVRAADEEEHRLFERDPFIYFYEDYLRAYDKATSKSRGVYYTPPPIVNFIVRAVDDLLKESFGITDGLADNKSVTVLDFACGTGTFLLEVFQRIFDNIGGANVGRADLIVREHFLRNIFGFEYLIAPYTIAHLKLSQYLKDRGRPLKENERLQVFLTNTLEPIEPLKNLLMPAVTEEVKAAQQVKEKPIRVITGNPPYSGESKNKGDWITKAIDEYKFTWEKIGGLEQKKRLGEKNSKWLHDDYVKFIRFAQMKMDGFVIRMKAPDGKLIEHSVPGIDKGIVGVITNHAWLDNPTFRGMRQSLMRSFEQIYVIDLHGNHKKKEKAPDGSKDENVFDIEQGVAISLFIKGPHLARGVWRSDVWGTRLKKYEATANSTLGDIQFTQIEVTGPQYLFVKQDTVVRAIYERGRSIKDIFIEGGTGIITKRDALTIQYTPEDIWKIVKEFVALAPEEARRRFHLPADVRDWKVKDAQADILRDGPNKKRIKRILYRPFDDRFTYYTGRARGFLGWPVERIARHFDHENIGLITSRLTKGENFRHAQVTDKMNEVIVMSSITSNNGFTFPLWLYDSEGARKENLSHEFRSFLDPHYEQHYTPEEVLGYIYGILHAPTYRTRFADFLRIDFPRIPFPKSATDFESLSKSGWALVQAHLLRDLQRRNLADYPANGDHRVELVRYSSEDETVWINDSQYFKPIPQPVWEFQIGGYQVLEKFLKSRKDRTLSLDEINHIRAVADCLAFTIEQMEKIDKAYKQAFQAGDK